MWKFFEGILVVFLIWAIVAGSYNAKEAHKHLHEIGCALDVIELCLFDR